MSAYYSVSFKSLFAFALLSAFFYCGKKINNKASANAKLKKADSIQYVELAFAGDVMNHKPQIDAAYNDSTGKYDFWPVFQYVSPIIEKADIAVANLETTFGGMPYSGYPQFSAPDTLAWFLKRAGFDLMVTANNHAADRSGKGIAGTIAGLDKAALMHTGTFLDSSGREKNYPFIIEKNGIRLAFLNYTYGTNGLTVPSPYIVNKIDTSVIANDIWKARKKKADAVIVVYHWGIEYQREPNEEQKMIARFSLSHGADLVIGSHPHVIQPTVLETYRQDTLDKKGWVVYSLGNFVSNQRDRYRDAGEIVFFRIKRNKNTKKLEVEAPSFVPTWVYIQPQPKTYYILPSARFAQDSTFIKDGKENMLQSLEDTRRHLLKDSSGLQEMEVK